LIRTLQVSDSFSVHHQESSTVHTATGICHTGFADYLLAGSGWNVLVHLVGFIVRRIEKSGSSVTSFIARQQDAPMDPVMLYKHHHAPTTEFRKHNHIY